MRYIKSPMNYIGNKYRIMAQMQRWFPKDIDLMVDLFCGGCDVSINTKACRHVANDINVYLIQILKAFQDNGPEKTLRYIDEKIAQWGLSKHNQEGYEAFRAYYNQTREPLDLYVLMCYSFNYQFRFNSDHEYNNPFGRAKSSFNKNMRENLLRMFEVIGDIRFMSQDFGDFDYHILKPGDFLYADPPYLITCGSYNDGKRGFKGWSAADDKKLFEILDDLDRRGVKFALSNVTRHKGLKNSELIQWKRDRGYHMHKIRFDYNNCNYHTRNKENLTEEVLIINY